MADSSNGLQIIDVSNPSAPALVGSYDTAGMAQDVAVSGTLAYVVNFDDGLEIVDVSHPAVPVRVGIYDTPGHAIGV